MKLFLFSNRSVEYGSGKFQNKINKHAKILDLVLLISGR